MAEEDFLDLAEGSGETGVTDHLCLVGKILQSKTLNVPAVVTILKAAWKTRAEFSITPWSNNTFLFRFEDGEDRNLILTDGPWSVMNNLLVLQPLQDGVVMNELDFSSCPFWIQIHGLPCEKMTRTNAELIGKRFGILLGVEGASEGLLLNRSFLRVRVEVNLKEPLPGGFWLRRRNNTGRDFWISYKHERLPDYCYACGRLGHENRECKFVTREEGSQSGYGPELKTERARKLLFHGTPVHQVVDEAALRVETILRQRPTIILDDQGARVDCQVERRVDNIGIQNIRSDVSGARSRTDGCGRETQQSHTAGATLGLTAVPHSLSPSNIQSFNLQLLPNALLSQGPMGHLPPNTKQNLLSGLNVWGPREKQSLKPISHESPPSPHSQIEPVSQNSPYFVTEPSESPNSSPPTSPKTPSFKTPASGPNNPTSRTIHYL